MRKRCAKSSCEIKVEALGMESKVRLVFPAKRMLSHAAKAFLEIVKGPEAPPPTA